MFCLTTLRCGCVGLLVLAAAIVGCGDGPKTYRIPGRLVYDDGTPVAGASVLLQTNLGDQVVTARGMAGPEGTFTLTTFTEGDGIVAGEHKVSISPMPAPEGVKRAPIPNAYWDLATSGLTTTIAPDTSEIVIKISRNGK